MASGAQISSKEALPNNQYTLDHHERYSQGAAVAVETSLSPWRAALGTPDYCAPELCAIVAGDASRRSLRVTREIVYTWLKALAAQGLASLRYVRRARAPHLEEHIRADDGVGWAVA